MIEKWRQTSYLIRIIPITETLRGGGFQVTGMIEWGQKSKRQKSLDQNFTPKNPNDDFPSDENFPESIK